MGANTTNTQSLYDQYVMGNYGVPPITIVKGAGAKVWDDEGKEYLDFTSGIAVNALGHCHPAWVARVTQQAGELVHTSNLYRHPLQGQLAKQLAELVDGTGKVFLCNSGTEANEALIKLARLYGKERAGEEGRQYKILAAKSAFHGRTFGGMSATPQEKIQQGFRPLLDGFAFGELNNLDSFRELIDENTVAIFLETIQGEGGINACTPEFLQGIRQLCDEHNLLLMLDEVQCGAGRTGKFFAFEHYEIKPDAIGMAKGLGGGFPIGAIWVADKYATLFKPGSHGSTFGGNPLACASALAVLDIVKNDSILQQVAENSAKWLDHLSQLAEKHADKVAQIRGKGYLIGIGMKVDMLKVQAALREKGLLVPVAGGNTIRLLPPLNISYNALIRASNILDEVLSAIDAPE